ncbi:Lariat debranching enzyme [Cyphellophora attinorum]|uniref:Lariat debranching enzyme n=1 Tax=Cyphellophora attinorum TaxID=1664694 RepID=A0A0N1H7V5_9EURO|nr:Lariat debranching enzyme [Phialophora attinorum]KPI42726.1 Lariat debranching enzyme [Phialophora attinorum]
MSPSNPAVRPLRIAVEGCGHGSLDIIYKEADAACQARGWQLEDLDFLIICGDFQAVRNARDLNCMSVPKRYRHMGDFHRYYSGESRAPVLTIVIGGNHEASNYLSELPYGGWLAPNIYYMGAVGVIRYGPYRILGMSGIYDSKDYRRPHDERLPYNRDEIRSIYHVRECDVAKLLQLRHPVDIGLSHDWPRRVEWFGDYEKLFAERPHFFDSARSDRLGSLPAEQVMGHLKPKHWVSGHMHIGFSATIKHAQHDSKDMFKELSIPDKWKQALPKAMSRNCLTGVARAHEQSPQTTDMTTQFLALDKPGHGNDFLRLLEIEAPPSRRTPPAAHYLERLSDGKYNLFYDEEWLSILREFPTATSHDGTILQTMDQLSTDLDTVMSRPATTRWIDASLPVEELFIIPRNFRPHAPVYSPDDSLEDSTQPPEYPNSQTETFCKTFGIAGVPARSVMVDDPNEDIVFG